jgi:homoserine kinase
MNTRHQATAFAPATVGNAAVGFDILGFAIEAIGDQVTVVRGEPGVRIESIEGTDAELPTDAAHNTATVGLVKMANDLALDFGFDVTIHKGIPIGSGMGGSAASAVAGVVAANALLPEPLPRPVLLAYALEGEAVASGAPHGDNAAPCLYGGLTLVRGHGKTIDVVEVPTPEGLWCTAVHPDVVVKTRAAREILPDHVPLATAVAQSGLLASFLAGCYSGDAERVGRSCRDLLVEPFRSQLVPGFEAARAAAMKAGALSFSLSGSGPTVFSLSRSAETAEAVRDAIESSFELATRGWVCALPAAGAKLVE